MLIALTSIDRIILIKDENQKIKAFSRFATCVLLDITYEFEVLLV